jgi:hypothetical protein
MIHANIRGSSVNGDGFVDRLDLLLIDNNNQQFVMALTP